MRIVNVLCLALFCVAGSQACGMTASDDANSAIGARRGADAGPDASSPGGEDLVDSGPPHGPVKFARVVEIFGQHCLPCHATSEQRPTALGKLDLGTETAAYDQLVGIAAQAGPCMSAGKMRVVPGDASASLLMDKLGNTPDMCGAPMPKPPTGSDFAPIPDPEIAEIRAWIEAGASRD
jgi:hypothetical protein